MRTIIAGTFRTVKNAEDTMNNLLEHGVPESSISYIYQNKMGMTERHTAGEAQTEAAGDAVKDTGKGAVSGAITGGAIGSLAGLALITGFLPGLGALFVGGPLAAALGLTGASAVVASGAATGAAAGGIIGALTGLGISEADVHLYEEAIKRGDILVIVDTEKEGVRKAFEDNEVEEIREYAWK